MVITLRKRKSVTSLSDSAILINYFSFCLKGRERKREVLAPVDSPAAYKRQAKASNSSQVSCRGGRDRYLADHLLSFRGEHIRRNLR